MCQYCTVLEFAVVMTWSNLYSETYITTYEAYSVQVDVQLS